MDELWKEDLEGSEALDLMGGVLEIMDAYSSPPLLPLPHLELQEGNPTENRHVCPERLGYCVPGPDNLECPWGEPLGRLKELTSADPENPCGIWGYVA